MQCDDCIVAGKHKKKKHKTKLTKKVLKTILTSTFLEEKKQKIGGAKAIISEHLQKKLDLLDTLILRFDKAINILSNMKLKFEKEQK